MLRGAALLCLLAAAVAQDALLETYGKQKIMTNCFGDEVHYSELATMEVAKRECHQEPLLIPDQQDPTNTFDVESPGLQHPDEGDSYLAPTTFPPDILATTGFQGPVNGKTRTARQAREQLFVDRNTVLALVGHAQAVVSNYTCLMKKMNKVDDNLNIRLDYIQRDYYQPPVDPALRQDMLEAIDLCYQLSRCLPVETTKSPIPNQIQRIIFFGKCEQEQRFTKCFKHDIRKNHKRFDLSGLPDASSEGRLERMAAALLVPRLVEELSGL